MFSVHISERLPPVLPPVKPTVRRLPSPKMIDETRSETDDERVIEPPIRQKLKSPSPIPMRMIERSEPPRLQPIVPRRIPVPPRSPSPEPTISMNGIPTTASLFKPIKSEPVVSRPLGDQWTNIYETNKKEDPAKDDLLSKLLSDEPEELKPVPPPSKQPSMITFEPSSILTNGSQKKPPPPRMTTTTVYDFEQAVINLHEGKPVTTQPTSTKSSIDQFDAFFDNNPTKPINHLNNRDDTFTTTQDQLDPFESIFTNSAAASNISTSVKPSVRPITTQNDKIQRPKIVNNGQRPVPNRTMMEEIEEIVL